MEPDTRHKSIIAIAFLIAVGWVNYHHYEKPYEAGFLVFICAFPLLYAGYYVSHVFRWVAFEGEYGSGLRIIPRIGAGVSWGFRSVSHAIGQFFRGIWWCVAWVFRSSGNAHTRWKYERERPERERRAREEAEAQAERDRQNAEAERLCSEEQRRQRAIEEEEEHKRRVAREAEITEARTKAENAARLEMQEQVNRLEREHAERMLAIEKERKAIAEARSQRHAAVLATLSDLVAKSKE